jgi:hypothetical protein
LERGERVAPIGSDIHEVGQLDAARLDERKERLYGANHVGWSGRAARNMSRVEIGEALLQNVCAAQADHERIPLVAANGMPGLVIT